MGNICLLLVVAALAAQLQQFTQARHPQTLCQRFERNCHKYAEYCSSPEEPTNDTTSGDSNPDLVATMWPSCCDLARLTNEAASGAYNIYGPGGHFSTQQAYCDVQGAWTVIQRRLNGTLPFNQTWNKYVDGFGTLNGEFWYGLENMHWLTRSNTWELQVTLTSDKGETFIAWYSQFRVSSSNEKYNLEISGYGESLSKVDDVLSSYNSQQFSTEHNLNNNQGMACPDKTGWWYTEQCIADRTMNLNGAYEESGDPGIKWFLSARNVRQIVQTEMKIRPHDCLKEKSN